MITVEFKELEDFNGYKDLLSFAMEVQRRGLHCTLIVPFDVCSKEAADIIVVVKKESFNDFIDLTDDERFLLNGMIRYHVVPAPFEESGWKYDI